LFHHDEAGILPPICNPFSVPSVIHRRHALGLLAAASLFPARSLANVSYQRSEFRNDLAKRFFDVGT
jgi:beta-lactamase class D